MKLPADAPPSRRVVPLWPYWLFFLVFFSLGFVLWYAAIRPHQRHKDVYDRLESGIQSLAEKRPESISREQWSFVIGWTMNGLGNCCAVHAFLKNGPDDYDRFRAFADEFELKLQEPVQMATIDWIWDQFVALSKYGQRYSNQWRPTRPDRLKEAEYVTIGPPVE